MTHRPEPVLIAGGGIAGLATSIALARRGIASIVCEQRTSFSESGAGIQIGPNGMRVLTELGVAAHLRPFAAMPAFLNVLSAASGNQLARLPLGSWIETRHGAPYWTAHRKDLQSALLAAAHAYPAINLRTATGITGWQATESGVAAVISGGETLAGRALVVADGVRSTLRHSISGTVHLAPTGFAALRGVISEPPSGLPANDVHVWLGPRTHAVHYPVRSGQETAIVLIVPSNLSVEVWNSPVENAAVQTIAAVMPKPLRDVVERVQHWRQWPLVCSHRLHRWTCGPVALIGDAAHPILPYLAQGAVMAIEDAVTLASALSGAAADTNAALAAWEKKRMPRVARLQHAAEQNGRIYHLSGFAARARDLGLRSLSGAQLMSRYDWLYGWTPPDIAA